MWKILFPNTTFFYLHNGPDYRGYIGWKLNIYHYFCLFALWLLFLTTLTGISVNKNMSTDKTIGHLCKQYTTQEEDSLKSDI